MRDSERGGSHLPPLPTGGHKGKGLWEREERQCQGKHRERSLYLNAAEKQGGWKQRVLMKP